MKDRSKSQLKQDQEHFFLIHQPLSQNIIKISLVDQIFSQSPGRSLSVFVVAFQSFASSDPILKNLWIIIVQKCFSCLHFWSWGWRWSSNLMHKNLIAIFFSKFWTILFHFHNLFFKSMNLLSKLLQISLISLRLASKL